MFWLYIDFIPHDFRRLFCRQEQHSRKRMRKNVNVTNGMSGCNFR
ncbi:hypothetical protein CLOL250_02061 [Clostridium sp. L2-50]|nr:hypothetical protein CLOL250_02061 [Clostridium sp. L2-50]